MTRLARAAAYAVVVLVMAVACAVGMYAMLLLSATVIGA